MGKTEVYQELSYDELGATAGVRLVCIVDELVALRSFLDEHRNGDAIWKFSDGNIYIRLRNIHIMVRETVMVYNEMVKEKIPVDTILYARKCFFEYHRLVANRMLAPLKKIIEKYASDIDDINRKQFQCVREDESIKYLDDSDIEQVDIDALSPRIANIGDSSRIGIFNLLKEVHSVIETFFKCDLMLLSKMSLENEDVAVFDALKEFVTQFARQIEKDSFNELKRQIQKIGNSRFEGSKREGWCEMLKTEEEMMNLAVKKELVSSKSPKMQSYSADDRKKLDDNSLLVRQLLDIFVDDELFDFDKLKEINYHLDSDNIDLFVSLVLRGNIIRSQINSELKEQYDVWLHGEIEIKDCSADKCANALKTEKHIDVLSSKKALDCWTKLIKAGIIDDNYMPVEKSEPKAAVVANRMMEKLEPAPQWNAFEDLWNMKNLSNKLSRARECSYFSNYDKMIKNILK